MTAKALLLRLLAPLFGGTLMASFAVAEGPMKGADFLRVVPDQMHQLQIVKVGTYAFRAQRSAIGQIAYNEDASTVVLTPFSGRVTRLIAKLGDRSSGAIRCWKSTAPSKCPAERFHRRAGCKKQGALPTQSGADRREARSRSS